jgi:hypothetical protein
MSMHIQTYQTWCRLVAETISHSSQDLGAYSQESMNIMLDVIHLIYIPNKSK